MRLTTLVKMDEIVVDKLGPASRCVIDFPSEDRQGCGRTVPKFHNISTPIDVIFYLSRVPRDKTSDLAPRVSSHPVRT
jgi:hypothetical protein